MNQTQIQTQTQTPTTNKDVPISLINLIKNKDKSQNKLISPISNSSKSNFKPNILLSNLSKPSFDPLTKPEISFNNSSNNNNNQIVIDISVNSFNTSNKPITKSINGVNFFNVEDYKLIEKIGEGTYGTIFSVKDKNNNKYALKKIIASDENELECFKQEYSTLQKIRHPFILNIYAICSKGFGVDITNTLVLYVLMELADSDLNKEIKKKKESGKLYTMQELVSMIYQLSTALAFLQSCGISHRDIKPHNILIFKNGIYKITDFGEAKFNSEKSLAHYTLRGTELYMSPLLFSGLKNNRLDIVHDPIKSDVFSLGLCFLFAVFLKIELLYTVRNSLNLSAFEKTLNNLHDKDVRFDDNTERYRWLIKLLLRMLSFNEKSRIDFVGICDEVEAHLDEVKIKVKY